LDIDRIGDITAKFTEVATEEEVKLTFSIHRRDATVRVFQEDCRTTVDASVIGLETTRAPATGTKDTLEVFLDIKQDSLCLGEPNLFSFQRLTCRQLYSTFNSPLLLLASL
jgi:hypothetical protein